MFLQTRLLAWQRDRTGALVDVTLAKKYGWKIGDHIILQGNIFRPTSNSPFAPSIIAIRRRIRSISTRKYLEESVNWFKGQAGWYATQVASADDVGPVSKQIDDMFHNSPLPTKTESEKAFQLSFVATLGNVKAFILGICGAVVFTILLVSANTMAMSVRGRTREVAVLKTLGFTRQSVLSLVRRRGRRPVGDGRGSGSARSCRGDPVARLPDRPCPVAIGVPLNMKVTLPTVLISILVAATVGFISGWLPAYNASRKNIVEGLRHIG